MGAPVRLNMFKHSLIRPWCDARLSKHAGFQPDGVQRSAARRGQRGCPATDAAGATHIVEEDIVNFSDCCARTAELDRSNSKSVLMVRCAGPTTAALQM